MRKKSARAAFDETAMSFFLAENVIDGFARGLSRDDFMLRREMAREGAMEEGKREKEINHYQSSNDRYLCASAKPQLLVPFFVYNHCLHFGSSHYFGS